MIKGMFYVDGNITSSMYQDFYVEQVKKALAGNGYKNIGEYFPGYNRHFIFEKNGEKKKAVVYFITGEYGESDAYALAESVNKSDEDAFVVTNVSLLFSFPKFIWDAKRGVFNLWMWKDDGTVETGEFVHINDLTERELREYHNIWKMWRNDALDIWRSWENDPEA